MYAQPAVVVQDVEALPRRPADVVVIDELIDLLAQQRQRPATTADFFQLLRRQLLPGTSVRPRRRGEGEDAGGDAAQSRADGLCIYRSGVGLWMRDVCRQRIDNRLRRVSGGAAIGYE